LPRGLEVRRCRCAACGRGCGTLWPGAAVHGAWGGCLPRISYSWPRVRGLAALGRCAGGGGLWPIAYGLSELPACWLAWLGSCLMAHMSWCHPSPGARAGNPAFDLRWPCPCPLEGPDQGPPGGPGQQGSRAQQGRQQPLVATGWLLASSLFAAGPVRWLVGSLGLGLAGPWARRRMADCGWPHAPSATSHQQQPSSTAIPPSSSRALWSGGSGFAAQGSGRALPPVHLVAPSLCPEKIWPGPVLPPSSPEISRGGHGILPSITYHVVVYISFWVLVCDIYNIYIYIYIYTAAAGSRAKQRPPAGSRQCHVPPATSLA
jgi:hypothetical protein